MSDNELNTNAFGKFTALEFIELVFPNGIDNEPDDLKECFGLSEEEKEAVDELTICIHLYFLIINSLHGRSKLSVSCILEAVIWLVRNDVVPNIDPKLLMSTLILMTSGTKKIFESMHEMTNIMNGKIKLFL